MNVKIRVLCAVLTIAAASGFSQTVTVAVTQNANAPESAYLMSGTIEDELFSLMFDSGFIVSNVSIGRAEAPWDSPLFAVKEAAFGMSDYLVALRVSYSAEEKKLEDGKTSYAQLQGLEWRLVRVNNPVILASGTAEPETSLVVDQDPYAEARILTDQLYSAVFKALSEAKKGGN